MSHFKALTKILVGAAALYSMAVHAAWPRYKVDGIASETVYGATNFYDMNNLGQAVGFSRFGGPSTKPLLYEAGRMIDLSARFQDISFGLRAINDRGDMGGIGIRGNQGFPWLYRDGRVLDLSEGLPPGSGSVLAINQAGHAVGYYVPDALPISRPFYYDGHAVQLLDRPEAGFTDVNDHGVAVSSDGFVYDHGDWVEIPYLDGLSRSYPGAINNAGQVVGRSVGGDGEPVLPFLFDQGVIRTLGSLGGEYGEALDINSHGWVVGSSQRQSGDYDAFLYLDGEMHNLEDLLVGKNAGQWDFTAGAKINDRGQILVRYVSRPGFDFQHALLTPVPEPRAWALMLAGLGVLGALATRRRIVA